MDDVKHISVEALERYAMLKLPRRRIGPLEDHLLICPECQDRVRAEIDFVTAMRGAAKGRVGLPRMGRPTAPLLDSAFQNLQCRPDRRDELVGCNQPCPALVRPADARQLVPSPAAEAPARGTVPGRRYLRATRSPVARRQPTFGAPYLYKRRVLCRSFTKSREPRPALISFFKIEHDIYHIAHPSLQHERHCQARGRIRHEDEPQEYRAYFGPSVKTSRNLT